MTREFEYMLQLFVNGAVGKKTEPDKSVSVEKIIALSIEHNIYYSVLHSMLMSDLISDKDTKAGYESELKNLRLTVYVKNFKLAEIFKQFEDADVPYAVLKGFSAAALYHDPYSRVSSDTDVLINKEDENKAISILTKNGFELTKLSAEDAKHSELVHPQLGIVELHISLYNEETSYVWLGKRLDDLQSEQKCLAFEKLNKLPIDELHFYIQRAEKNVEFLFMHNVTHFIAGGTSIKAIMDFFLAYINNKELDYGSFYNMIKGLRFDTVFKTMLAIVEYFLPFENFKVPFYENPGNDYVEVLLADMEMGKWLGYGNDAYISQRQYVFEEKTSQSGLEKKKLLKKLFPSSRYLRNNYKYAMQYPILVPVAWLHRLLRFCICKLTEKNKRVKNGNFTRIELLKKLDLI